ncbi:MAG: cytochrome c maturation protein CcmE [Chitinophagaceae bacterium]
MKKSHIILLVLIAASIAIISATFLDFSTYETFTTAAKKDAPSHVMGVLDKSRPMVYNPIVDPNHCTFYVKDKQGVIKEVVFNGAKPTDIEKSEQIVMSGRMVNDQFRCNSIQMKCPSKYKKESVAVGG